MSARPDTSTFSGSPVRPRREISRWPLLLASATVFALAVAVLVVLAEAALMTRRGQDFDQGAMETVYARENTISQLLNLLGNISIGTTAIAMVVCVGAALLRKRYAGAFGAVVIVAGSNITTQVLKKSLLERPELSSDALGGLPNSLPSGHTTVVASVVLAALLVAGTPMRGFLAVLGGFAITLTGASTLVTGWHRPSDVLAGVAVALAWGAAVVFGLTLRRTGESYGRRWPHAFLAVLGAAAAGVILIAIGVRPDNGWPGFVGAATVLGLIGFASAGTVAVFARLSGAHAR